MTDKMWYSVKETLDNLRISENILHRKLQMFNQSTRDLPGLKGQFISSYAYNKLAGCIKGPRWEGKN
jgi:hypothetical protein